MDPRRPRGSGVFAVHAVTLAAMLAVTVLLASGCGTHRTVAAPSGAAADPSHPIPLLPTANDLTTAVVNTRDHGAAQLTIETRTTTDAVTETARAVGKGFTGPGFADLMWTSAGVRMRELVNDQGVFVQADPPSGRWVRHPVGSSTPTSAAADPLRDLGLLRGVVDEGPVTLDGIRATRYSGSLPADDGDVAVTVWVDGAGLIIRVDRQHAHLTPDGLRAVTTTSTTLADFGTILNLMSPPSNQVDQVDQVSANS